MVVWPPPASHSERVRSRPPQAEPVAGAALAPPVKALLPPRLSGLCRDPSTRAEHADLLTTLAGDTRPIGAGGRLGVSNLVAQNMGDPYPQKHRGNVESTDPGAPPHQTYQSLGESTGDRNLHFKNFPRRSCPFKQEFGFPALTERVREGDGGDDDGEAEDGDDDDDEAEDGDDDDGRTLGSWSAGQAGQGPLLSVPSRMHWEKRQPQ